MVFCTWIQNTIVNPKYIIEVNNGRCYVFIVMYIILLNTLITNIYFVIDFLLEQNISHKNMSILSSKEYEGLVKDVPSMIAGEVNDILFKWEHTNICNKLTIDKYSNNNFVITGDKGIIIRKGDVWTGERYFGEGGSNDKAIVLWFYNSDVRNYFSVLYTRHNTQDFVLSRAYSGEYVTMIESYDEEEKYNIHDMYKIVKNVNNLVNVSYDNEYAIPDWFDEQIQNGNIRKVKIIETLVLGKWFQNRTEAQMDITIYPDDTRAGILSVTIPINRNVSNTRTKTYYYTFNYDSNGIKFLFPTPDYVGEDEHYNPNVVSLNAFSDGLISATYIPRGYFITQDLHTISMPHYVITLYQDSGNIKSVNYYDDKVNKIPIHTSVYSQNGRLKSYVNFVDPQLSVDVNANNHVHLDNLSELERKGIEEVIEHEGEEYYHLEE